MKKQAFSSRELINSLKKHQVFNKIFGENYHIQLIQRAQELIKFLITEKELGPEEMDVIWACTKKD